jgi:hypothetical protein
MHKEISLFKDFSPCGGTQLSFSHSLILSLLPLLPLSFPHFLFCFYFMTCYVYTTHTHTHIHTFFIQYDNTLGLQKFCAVFELFAIPECRFDQSTRYDRRASVLTFVLTFFTHSLNFTLTYSLFLISTLFYI